MVFKCCFECGLEQRTPKTCEGCLAAWYCNRACQVAHWKKHKKGCRRSAANEAAVDSTAMSDPKGMALLGPQFTLFLRNPDGLASLVELLHILHLPGVFSNAGASAVPTSLLHLHFTYLPEPDPESPTRHSFYIESGAYRTHAEILTWFDQFRGGGVAGRKMWRDTLRELIEEWTDSALSPLLANGLRRPRTAILATAGFKADRAPAWEATSTVERQRYRETIISGHVYNLAGFTRSALAVENTDVDWVRTMRAYWAPKSTPGRQSRETSMVLATTLAAENAGWSRRAKQDWAKLWFVSRWIWVLWFLYANWAATVLASASGLEMGTTAPKYVYAAAYYGWSEFLVKLPSEAVRAGSLDLALYRALQH